MPGLLHRLRLLPVVTRYWLYVYAHLPGYLHTHTVPGLVWLRTVATRSAFAILPLRFTACYPYTGCCGLPHGCGCTPFALHGLPFAVRSRLVGLFILYALRLPGHAFWFPRTLPHGCGCHARAVVTAVAVGCRWVRLPGLRYLPFVCPVYGCCRSAVTFTFAAVTCRLLVMRLHFAVTLFCRRLDVYVWIAHFSLVTFPFCHAASHYVPGAGCPVYVTHVLPVGYRYGYARYVYLRGLPFRLPLPVYCGSLQFPPVYCYHGSYRRRFVTYRSCPYRAVRSSRLVTHHTFTHFIYGLHFGSRSRSFGLLPFVILRCHHGLVTVYVYFALLVVATVYVTARLLRLPAPFTFVACSSRLDFGCHSTHGSVQFVDSPIPYSQFSCYAVLILVEFGYTSSHPRSRVYSTTRLVPPLPFGCRLPVAVLTVLPGRYHARLLVPRLPHRTAPGLRCWVIHRTAVPLHSSATYRYPFYLWILPLRTATGYYTVG